jgi:hypothetical protein
MQSVGGMVDDKDSGLARAAFPFAPVMTIRGPTEARAEFPIEKPGSPEERMPPRTGGTFALVGLRGDHLRLMVLSPLPAGTFTLFNIHRKKLAEQILGPLRAGAHRVDIPVIAPGVYSMRISLGSFTGCAYLVCARNRYTLMRRFPEDKHGFGDLRSASALRLERNSRSLP